MPSEKSTKSKASKKRLGKGLEALFSQNNIDNPTSEIENTEGFDIQNVKISEIRPNPYQPRKHFDEDSINELTESIKEHGVFQPLIVRKSVKGYDLLAGERRLRASKKAGLKTVPVIVKDYSETQMMELALLENLQREDLSAIEEANAYKALMENLGLTQEQLSLRVGKSRPHIANTLRLLQLPKQAQSAIERQDITMGHAKVLISIDNEKVVLQIVDLIVEEGLSVREVERLVQNIHSGVSKPISKAKQQVKKDNQIEKLEQDLAKFFDQKVQIQYRNQKGKLTIPFNSDEDLNYILEKFGLMEE